MPVRTIEETHDGHSLPEPGRSHRLTVIGSRFLNGKEG